MYLKLNFLLNFIISYVYCIDLLMWSPIKFDFLFYDFFLFTMIFQRFIQNKHKRKIGKPLGKTTQGGHMSNFMSSRRQNIRFSSLRWKDKLDL